MKYRLIHLLFTALMLVMMPAWSLAADTEIDARLQGYEKSVSVDGGSTGLTWLLLVFLSVIAVLVLFKDAKRTHLD